MFANRILCASSPALITLTARVYTKKPKFSRINEKANVRSLESMYLEYSVDNVDYTYLREEVEVGMVNWENDNKSKTTGKPTEL